MGRKPSVQIQMTDQELNEIIAGLNRTQREALEKYLEYQTYQDNDDVEITSIKKETYDLYKNTISGLIAKVEVYAHDLPMPIYSITDNIVRMHSLVAQIEQKDFALKGYKQIIHYENFFINILYLMLTKLYVMQIKTYIKVLTRFNHKGVLINDTPVLCEVEKQLKKISGLVNQGKKNFKTIYSINWVQIEMFISNVPPFIERFIDREVVIMNEESQLISELSSAFSAAQYAINLCETNFPNIVNNGYNESLFKRFCNVMPMLISFLLALYGVFTICYKLLGA